MSTRRESPAPKFFASSAARDPKRTGVHASERRPAEFDAASLRSFRRQPRAWAFFQAQPPGYRRTSTFRVVCAKQEVTRARRLEQLIADSAAGRRIALLARPENSRGRKP